MPARMDAMGHATRTREAIETRTRMSNSRFGRTSWGAIASGGYAFNVTNAMAGSNLLFTQRLLVIFRRIEIAERLQLRIDVTQLVGRDDAGRLGLE